MIAKRAHRRQDSRSSFSTLAAYITRDGQLGQQGDIEYSRVSHCGFDTVDLAVREIEATQARNTRSKMDKTYHLIVSFREDERIERKQLVDIEDAVCQTIGLGDHQRVSAVHRDTDNLHIHIAINKIHPVNHRAIEPYYDYIKLDQACAELEFKHELMVDNRIANTRDRGPDEAPQPGRAGDMEAFSGLDSFQRWIQERKEKIGQGLDTAKSWADVHRGLGRYDLVIRPRGAGLVISARREKAFTKASDLGRGFSKGALEKRFGEYQPPSKEMEGCPVEARYAKVPRSPATGLSSSLWNTYNAEKHRIVAEKKQAREGLWKQRSEQIRKGRSDYAARRRAVKIDTLLNRHQKRAVYSQLYEHNKRRVKAERSSHRAALQAIHDHYPAKTWKDFLIDHAADGNADAVLMLRRTYRGQSKNRGDAFLGTGEGQILLPEGAMERHVRPNGDVLYQAEGIKVRDTGEQLELDSGGGPGMAEVLRMARLKFGDHIRVSGGAPFKTAVVEAAIASGQAVTFADPVMEKRRQVLHSLKHPPAPAKKETSRGPRRGPSGGWISDDGDDLGR